MAGAADNESSRLPTRLLQDIIPRQPLLQKIQMRLPPSRGEQMSRKIKSSDLTSADLGKQIEIPNFGDTQIIGQLRSLSFKPYEGGVLTTFTLYRKRGITTHSTAQVVIIHEP